MKRKNSILAIKLYTTKEVLEEKSCFELTMLKKSIAGRVT
ncbi:hypothetical protein VS84_02070 [Vibrio cholerae]|nr:hypothetical protein VS84_02070 [Vibrio cholerae]KKP20881.1 hypothetical protein VS86_01372 [Vibrio cholerae]